MKTSRTATVAIAAVISILLAASLVFVSVSYFPTSQTSAEFVAPTGPTFQMAATEASNGSILFSGVITNNFAGPATGMRILVNGTYFGGDWITTYSPGFPSPGAPLASGSSVTFHASLRAGAPPGWPIACQSFRCSMGDKLLIEVDMFGASTNIAYGETYITIGTA